MGVVVVGIYWGGDGVHSVCVLLVWREAEGEVGKEGVDLGIEGRWVCGGNDR